MNKRAQLKFALKVLRRDLKAGELRVLALALVVAVASVTAVGFFTDRIGRAVERQAADVLAADLTASSGLPLPERIATAAEARDLNTARHVRFPSVVVNAADESQLVAVKAITAAYPLRGELRLAHLDTPGEAAPLEQPAPGTIWVDVRLKNILALEQGDEISLGTKRFIVDRLIQFEPDRGQNVFELAPRVMMGIEDVERAGLLGPGSRARYSLLMAGEYGAVSDMRKWLDTELAGEIRVADVREGSPQMRRALNRAERFLGLASVVTVLLAGAAVAMAVRHFALRQADASAVLRTLGATRTEVTAWLVLRLCMIALIASVLGIGIGWWAQQLLADLLERWFQLGLPAPGLQAPLVGTLTAFIALAGFGLSPVLRAGRVPVMRVLQQDYSGLDTRIAAIAASGVIATWLVVLMLSRDLLLSGIVVVGVLAMLLVFALFGKGIIAAVRRSAGARYRLSVAGLQRRAGSSVMQLSAFAMGIMALLLISIVRVDLLTAWERELPADAPNVFVINIQPDQVDGFARKLASEGIEHNGIYPLVRARLVAHNGSPVTDSDRADGREWRRREYNLSYADSLPPSNEMVAGDWWETDGSAPPSLSLEYEWAERSGFSIGDTLTFRAAGIETTATVVNLRAVDWESFDVNFFALASASTLEGLPATFVTSFHLEGEFATATTEWVREFPGIAPLDIGAIISRVKVLMDRASMAVEYVFLFTLVAGFCVLLAAVQSSQEERIRESAVLRALGASHAQVRQAVIVEFAILGAISGFLAALFATIIAWALSYFVFELPFSANAGLWVLGIVGGAVGISTAGYLATRRVLHTPPIVALRHTA